MMNAEDEMYQRRRKVWLSYGRALLTIAVLGLLTVALYAVTKPNSDKDEHTSRVIVDRSDPSGSSGVDIVKSFKSDDAATIVQLDQRRVFKRSVDLRQKKIDRNLIEMPKSSDKIVQSLNDVNNDNDQKTHNEHLKLYRRQGINLNPEHRHADGDIYFFQGYKCVPIRKPQKQLSQLRAEPIKARQNAGRSGFIRKYE